MKKSLDLDKIAKGLGGERRGKFAVSGGHFGAMQLVGDIQAHFRTPAGGGRATNPAWTTKRLVPLADQTLKRLEQLAREIEEKRNIHIEPMQVAALLIENSLAKVTGEEAEAIVNSVAVGS